MNKPMSVKINNFCDRLAALLNEAELPFYVLEPYMKNALEEVHTAADKQRKLELETYVKEMEEKENAEGIRSRQLGELSE